MEMYPVSPGVYINVDKARRLLRGRRANARWYVPDARVSVERGLAGIHRGHVRRGRLKQEPVIMVEIFGYRVLVDGWHRSMRADSEGRSWLPAHLLTEDEARRCAMHQCEVAPD